MPDHRRPRRNTLHEAPGANTAASRAVPGNIAGRWSATVQGYCPGPAPAAFASEFLSSDVKKGQCAVLVPSDFLRINAIDPAQARRAIWLNQLKVVLIPPSNETNGYNVLVSIDQRNIDAYITTCSFDGGTLSGGAVRLATSESKLYLHGAIAS